MLKALAGYIFYTVLSQNKSYICLSFDKQIKMEKERKGARSLKDLTPAILEQLNNGTLESVNLTEWLAVDQTILIVAVLKQHNRTQYLSSILSEIEKLEKKTSNPLNECIGQNLLSLIISNNDNDFFDILSNHMSDSVRCWATYIIGYNTETSISQKLESIKPFAAHHHFGVREIAWMALRKNIIEHLDKSIIILTEWTSSANEYVRRFATESIRPRGVWSTHIEELKENPEIALPILEPLRSDPSKYVRDSVGNWLNDASKTKPDFVTNLCIRWEKESPTKETTYIIKKALRTIHKNG